MGNSNRLLESVWWVSTANGPASKVKAVYPGQVKKAITLY